MTYNTRKLNPDRYAAREARKMRSLEVIDTYMPKLKEIYNLENTQDMLEVTHGLNMDEEMAALKLLHCNQLRDLITTEVRKEVITLYTSNL